MTFPFMATAIALAEIVPEVSKWFSNNKSDAVSDKMIATKMVDIAKQVTGCTEANEAISELHSNPSLLIDFQQAMQKLDQDLAKALIQDRQNARVRDMTLLKAGHQNMRADIMVVSAAIGLVCCLLCLIGYKTQLPGEAVGIISTVAGIFGACLKDAYAFEFGSSRGSKNKDLLLNKLS